MYEPVNGMFRVYNNIKLELDALHNNTISYGLPHDAWFRSKREEVRRAWGPIAARN